MANPQDPYARARLILEYLRAFAWPVIVLLILVVYRQDLVDLISEREFEAFGVRVGPRIEEVEENVEAELADIRALLERQKQAAPEERERIAEDLAAKVEQLGENVSREVQQIRQLEQAPPRPAARRTEAREPVAAAGGRAEAAELERRGFEALIAGDREAALAAIRPRLAAVARLPQPGRDPAAAALLRRPSGRSPQPGLAGGLPADPDRLLLGHVQGAPRRPAREALLRAAIVLL